MTVDVAEATAAVQDLSGMAADRAHGAAPPGDGDIAEAARQAVRRAFGRVLGFKPVTTATVLRLQR